VPAAPTPAHAATPSTQTNAPPHTTLRSPSSQTDHSDGVVVHPPPESAFDIRTFDAQQRGARSARSRASHRAPDSTVTAVPVSSIQFGGGGQLDSRAAA
jgi:hypothetical protein